MHLALGIVSLIVRRSPAYFTVCHYNISNDNIGGDKVLSLIRMMMMMMIQVTSLSRMWTLHWERWLNDWATVRNCSSSKLSLRGNWALNRWLIHIHVLNATVIETWTPFVKKAPTVLSTVRLQIQFYVRWLTEQRWVETCRFAFYYTFYVSAQYYMIKFCFSFLLVTVLVSLWKNLRLISAWYSK